MPERTVRAWISTGTYDTHVDAPAQPDGSAPASFRHGGHLYVLAAKQWDFGARHYVRAAPEAEQGALW